MNGVGVGVYGVGAGVYGVGAADAATGGGVVAGACLDEYTASSKPITTTATLHVTRKRASAETFALSRAAKPRVGTEWNRRTK